MGNPYYVQPQSSLGDIIDPMLKVAAFQQGQKSLEQHAQQLAEMKRVNQIQHGIGTPGTPDFVPGTEQQKIELSRQQLRQQGANIPIHRQNFGVIEARTISNKLNTLGVKKENPMLAEIDGLGKDPTVGNYQAYEYFTSAYPQYRESIMSEIADDYVRKMDKDPNYANTEQGKQQKAFVDAISQDPTGEKIFSHVFAQTLASKQAEDDNSKAAIAAANLEARAKLSAPDRQYVAAKTKFYMNAGLDQETATIKAVEDLYTQEARKVKEGKFPPSVNVSVAAPQQTQFIDPNTGNPLIFDKRSGTYKVAQVEGGGAAPRMVNPSAGEREKTAAFDTLSDQVARIKNTYKPQYVGIASGQAGRISQLWDPNEAAFRQVISDVKDSLLRARSGAQINEQEYARLSKLVPDFTDSTKQFEGKLRSFETTLSTLRNNRIKAQRKGGVYIRENNQGGAPQRPPLSSFQR